MAVAFRNFLTSDDTYARQLAAWLIARTRLGEAQVRAWTGLSAAAYADIAAAGAAHPQTSPINQRLLSWPEVRRCEASAEARLEKRTTAFAEPELMTAPPPKPLRDVQFRSARLAGLLFLSNGRNAWHSTWVNQYFPGALSGRVATVKARAEEQRTPGSVFYIDRVPALVLQCDQLTLIGVEVNPGPDLADRAEVFDGPLSARRILQAYADVRPNTVLWLHAQGNWRYADWAPEPRLRSSSVGAQYYLNWDVRPAKETPTVTILDAVKRARRSLRRGC